MTKVLFIAMHRPNRSPSQRYRFEQYFPYLEANGIYGDLSYLISAEDDRVLYQPHHYIGKLRIFLKGIRQRLADIKKARKYDYIYIQREAFMTGSTYFERQLARLPVPVIFDFDDAIWLPDPSGHHGLLGNLKNPAKTSKIITLADTVVAGNDYLAGYARQFNDKVQVIPTTIDTHWYQPAGKPAKRAVVIGWSGSFSTLKHFTGIVPVLKRIKEKYQDQVRFKVIGDPEYRNPELGIIGQKWQAATEVEDLQEIDIGIMPLPDNEWARGKCGAKGLQYMGVAVPTVMSPVGVNTAIITDGINGFLAGTEEEWFTKLSQLIDSPALRSQLGQAGRETVVKHYSVEAHKRNYLALFGQRCVP